MKTMMANATQNNLELAELEWTAEGAPRSKRFGDIYFSLENGLAETRHTFIDGNNLQYRFKNLGENSNFTLIETGFGTGLNFLATLQCWQKLSPLSARLDYISIEAHPLSPSDLARALALWPELADQAVSLQESYPPLTPGFHSLIITERVRLILVFAPVESSLKQLAAPLHPELLGCRRWHADAWFLDGFAPRSNPQMWDEQLFPLIGVLSKPSSTLATFTAAGDVRRGLQSCGFSMQRVPGYGRKRDMLVGELTDSSAIPMTRLLPSRQKPFASWALHPPLPKPQSVAVLGAGIAGVSLAARLAQENISVNLIDAAPAAMQSASGNPQAALFARLSPDAGDLEDFALTALCYASNYYACRAPRAFQRTGLIQLPRNAEELVKMQRIASRLNTAPQLVQFAHSSQLSQYAGVALNSDGLWFPSCGWVQPHLLAEELLDHPNIQCHFNQPVGRYRHEENKWHLASTDGKEILSADALVICAGFNSRELIGLDWLPTRSIRGQISLIRSEQLKNLQTVLCGEGYLAPPMDGQHSLGATYELNSESTAVTSGDHQKNIEALNKILTVQDPTITKGRAGVRCATPDYLPMCGPAPDLPAMPTTFAALSKDARSQIVAPGPTIPSLYLNLGYGSRGFCYAPLGAEYLTSIFTGRCSPLPDYLNAALHPARFIIRAMIRNKPVKAPHDS